MRAQLLTPGLALLLACGAEAPPAVVPPPPTTAAPVASTTPSPAAPPSARQLTDETTITTASGATFTAPKGWWVTQSPDSIELEGRPEMKAVLVETPEPDPRSRPSMPHGGASRDSQVRSRRTRALIAAERGKERAAAIFPGVTLLTA